MFGAAIRSETLLEGSYLRAKDKLRAIDDLSYCSIDFRLYALVLRLKSRNGITGLFLFDGLSNMVLRHSFAFSHVASGHAGNNRFRGDVSSHDSTCTDPCALPDGDPTQNGGV